MTTDIKVSLIVPIYNSSQYIRRCLDSCVNQTLEELEVILVNDCSPDPIDSEIMREYEAKYTGKVRCIWHDKNKGPGGARTTGIKAARGEYIAFSDADDYNELDKCEIMYNSAISENAAMVCCNMDMESAGKRRLWNDKMLVEPTLDNLVQGRAEIMHVGATLIAKKLFVDNELYFLENFWCDDVICVFLLFILSRKFTKINKSCYIHCINLSSVLAKGLPRLYLERANAGIALKREAQRLSIYNEFKEHIDAFCFNYAIRGLNLFVLYDISENLVNDFMRLVKKIEPDFSHNKFIFPSVLELYNILLPLQGDTEKMASAFLGWVDKMTCCGVFYNDNKDIFNKVNQITIWGAGRQGRRLIRYFRNKSVDVQVTDSDEKKHGLEIEPGVIVKAWNGMSKSTEVVVVAAKIGGDEIEDNLLNENFRGPILRFKNEVNKFCEVKKS